MLQSEMLGGGAPMAIGLTPTRGPSGAAMRGLWGHMINCNSGEGITREEDYQQILNFKAKNSFPASQNRHIRSLKISPVEISPASVLSIM